ncbi:hypothetical protein [Methyloferula stellata]|uniref:hypothetical protein n=1 Tax=Methyloferula stellata TaxID=876270 RepID=UPI00035F691A|nr:hypothetical protein [Methyloferula stellata]
MEFEQSMLLTAVWEDRRSETIYRSLNHLLAMAHKYRDEGCLRQAMDLYWMLSEEHSETVQAQEARESLLDLGETYEREAERHTARAVYERLSDVHGHAF